MLNLLILMIFFIGAYDGYKRGIVLKLLQAIGFTVIIIFTMDYYKLLSDFLYLLVPYPTPFAPEANPYLFYDERFIFSMDMSYYNMLAFLIIFLVGWVLVKFLIQFISYTLEKLRAPEPLSGIGGAIIGIATNYIGLFFLFTFLSIIPLDIIQTQLFDSSIAHKMVTSTPELSERVYQTFIVEENEKAAQELPTMDIEPVVQEEPVEENQE